MVLLCTYSLMVTPGACLQALDAASRREGQVFGVSYSRTSFIFILNIARGHVGKGSESGSGERSTECSGVEPPVNIVLYYCNET